MRVKTVLGIPSVAFTVGRRAELGAGMGAGSGLLGLRPRRATAVAARSSRRPAAAQTSGERK
jgi:hypothetical protein